MVRASGNEVAQRHPGAVAKRPGSAVVKQPGDDVSPRPGAQVSDGTGDVPKTYKPARVALALGSGLQLHRTLHGFRRLDVLNLNGLDADAPVQGLIRNALAQARLDAIT